MQSKMYVKKEIAVKSKLKNEKLRTNDSTHEQESERLTQILELLETLYNMRLIEKLIRPTDTSTKKQQVQKYKDRFNQMHEKINQVLNRLSQGLIMEEGGRERSAYGDVTNRTSELKKKIRMVETRYNEVLYEGSFKFFPKVNRVLNLESSLELIIIEEWTLSCLEKLNGRNRNCC